MTTQLTDRYLQAKRIAMAAIDLSLDERETFITSAATDEELVREVRWMLAAMENTSASEVPLVALPTFDLSGHDAQANTPRQYRVLNRLGEGGMGVVYLAERFDGGFVQQVALKMLGAGAQGSPILHERFARERQLLARLEHPGIARLLDGGVLAERGPYLAMEYVDGERIDTWCTRHRLGLRERIALFLKVCAAVEYAHRNLVIHRDIKPANILVTEAGEPKLLDFGIARLVEAEGHAAAFTQTGQHAMTVAYASPEQVACEPLTTTTDVYSLGAVLYQLVCGRTPFDQASSPAALLGAVLHAEALPPSRQGTVRDASIWRDGRVPPDVDAIVLKALRKKSNERYPSVAALADDLQRYLEKRPVEALRGQRLYRATRFMQRYRGILLGAALVVLLLSGFAVERERQLHQLEAERNKAQALADFMTKLFANAAPMQARGEQVTVREVLDRGVRDLIARTDIDQRTRAELLMRMGEAYLGLHLPKDAQAPLLAAQRSLQQASASPGEQAKVLDRLTDSDTFLGDYAQAIARSRQAQALLLPVKATYFAPWARARWRELFNENNGRMLAPDALIASLHELIAEVELRPDPSLNGLLAGAYESLAQAYMRKGDNDAALRYMKLSLQLGERSDREPQEQLVARSNYAQLLIHRGDLEQAVAELKDVDRGYVHLVGADTVPRVPLLGDLARALGELGRKQEAMDTYAQAVDVARRTGGPESYFYREIAVKYAYQLVKAGRYVEARDLLEPLLPTLQAHAGTGMEAVAYAYGLTTFAIIKMESDHDPATALKLLDQARQALGTQAGEFLSVYAFISQYAMRAHVALHQAGAAQKALDDYQALLDTKKEPLESPSRKDLAKLRDELTNAGRQAAAR